MSFIYNKALNENFFFFLQIKILDKQCRYTYSNLDKDVFFQAKICMSNMKSTKFVTEITPDEKRRFEI